MQCCHGLRGSLLLLGVIAACSGPRDSSSHPHAATNGLVARPAPVTIAPLAPAQPEPRVRTVPPGLSEAELAHRLESEPDSVASLSIGKPNRGALLNAAQMPDGPHWHVVEPDHAWGTDESIRSIVRAVSAVNDEFPASPDLYIGHLSSRRGGYLRPHRSHQSGRDADIGFYYSGGPGWYLRGTAKTLDQARTWALIKAFALDPNVEGIFVDRSIQALLRQYAEKAGESKEFLDGIFESHLHKDRLIRHEWGHLTHLHVRFRCPIAEDAGARLATKATELERRTVPPSRSRPVVRRARVRSRS
jgi:murein endopeptidase